MTAEILTLPQTAERILAQCRTAGISLSSDGNSLRYRAERGKMTEDLRQTIKQHKDTLIALLHPDQADADACRTDAQDAILTEREAEQDTQKLTPSPEGKALLEPFLPVIKAAHRNELPPIALTWTRFGDLNAYVCALSASIWYGVCLNDPQLPERLENLRILQNWYSMKEGKP